ncbi:YceI family protein [Phenylobacterium sp.]|jgi:cytochrome b561/polyisoprenoid-binding protein YceI|uniref:YceI family protein n=1 Tax=Phenylobacterium sp. TaxID=1871053 RepID=UPI0037C8632C
MTDLRTLAAARYSTGAILLHWTIAALIVLQVVLAGRMEGRTPEAFAIVQLHKSIGISILLLSLIRLAWRMLNPPPPEPASLTPWERRLSHGVHWALYGVMIGMPITGWLAVSASRYAFPTLLFGVVPWPHVPGLADLTPAARAIWHQAGEVSHELIIKAAYGLIALHVLGALKHQIFRGDPRILPRMIPGVRFDRRFDRRLLAIPVALLAVVAFGRTYHPPRPHSAPAPVAATPEPEAPIPPKPAAATTVVEPRPDVGPIAWKVSRGSSLTFATAWSGEAIEGRFDRWMADIQFNPDALDRSRVSVSIDMASAVSGDEQRDASLPSADWFDTAVHPKATFTASRFERTGDGRFVARGQLSLRGVSRPLTLPFRLKIVGDRAEVSGVTTLDRTTFGVGQGEWASTDQIPAKVTVRIVLAAQRSSPSP